MSTLFWFFKDFFRKKPVSIFNHFSSIMVLSTQCLIASPPYPPLFYHSDNHGIASLCIGWLTAAMEFSDKWGLAMVPIQLGFEEWHSILSIETFEKGFHLLCCKLSTERFKRFKVAIIFDWKNHIKFFNWKWLLSNDIDWTIFSIDLGTWLRYSLCSLFACTANHKHVTETSRSQIRVAGTVPRKIQTFWYVKGMVRYVGRY